MADSNEMIVYDKFFDLLKKKGITTTDIRKTGLVSEATLQKMRRGNAGLAYDSLNRLCAFFACQPSDLFEYVPDQDVEAWADEAFRKIGKERIAA